MSEHTLSLFVFGSFSLVLNSTMASASHAFRNLPRLHPVFVIVCVLTTSCVQAQVHNSLATVLALVHAQSLLITDELPPASRFLYRFTSTATSLSSSPPSLSLPLPFSFFLPSSGTLEPLFFFLWQRAQDTPFAEWAAGSGGGKKRNGKKDAEGGGRKRII